MIRERISEITERWFLREEALFIAFCTHKVQENSSMKCAMRVGKGMIEVNPIICANMLDKELEMRLVIEVIRILLKHPYDRQPNGCCALARALGSNCVISDAYGLQRLQIERPSDFGLPGNGHYEFYAREIQKQMQTEANANGSDDNGNGEGEGEGGSQQSGLGGDEAMDLAANWEHDELMTAQINETIKGITSWGTVPRNMVEKIIASTKARIDYKKVLAGFRASVISQARRLTRMRPNRRSGFDAMGSQYNFTTSLVIGVDVSGSITTEDLQNFYTTINHFFQYGIKQIDVVQFDTKLKGVESIKRASVDVKVTGRGGTCFQPFIDFVATHPEYDGAIIYTDGYAPAPRIPAYMNTPLCWVVNSEKAFEQHREWMSQSGKVCVIEND